MASQSPEIIRASIEETRRELAFSVNDLRSKVAELTDWRRQLAENRTPALVGAAVAGFVIGGGVAATTAGAIARHAISAEPEDQPRLKGRINQSVCRWCYGRIPLEDLCKAAKAMGIQRSNLYRKLEKYGIERGDTLESSAGSE